MKFILKLIIGFAIVMCALYSMLIIKNYTQECLIASLCVVAFTGCYFLGDFVFKVIDDVLKGWK